MERTVKYTAPTTRKELQDLSTLSYDIEGEVWKPIPIVGCEKYQVSNYGRVMHIKTNKLRKCVFYGHITKDSVNFINSITSLPELHIAQCDMILHAFYPEIADTHINIIPLDGNIFNLSLSNIKFVPNSYYVSGGFEEEWIWYKGEKTNYTVDIYGTIINQETGKVLRANKPIPSVVIGINHWGKLVRKDTRARYMVEAFIPNPDNLRCGSIIDPTKTKLHISNICWTNRIHLTKK